MLDFGGDGVEQAVDEADDPGLLVEVGVLVDVLQALHQGGHHQHDVLQLLPLLDLLHRLLNYLHVLVVPLGFFGALDDSAFFFLELLHQFLTFLICLVRVKDLHADLHIALLRFFINCF